MPLDSTIEYKRHSKGLLETSLLSCSFRLPEAVFLGFLKGSSPFDTLSKLSFLKPSIGITISPLMSKVLIKSP